MAGQFKNDVSSSLLVCIPTYNESENIENIIRAVFSASTILDAEVLVVDDNSPDGTADIVEHMIPEWDNRLHILNRPCKGGLGKAYLAAFQWGLERDYDCFLEMDADFSHNPKYIPQMLKELTGGADVVIGSRNISGGSVEGWGLIRNVISKGGSLYSRLVLGCPLKDLTGGYNLWTREALEKVGLNNIISNGYSFQVEMKYRAWAAGCKIKEIPILFVDRKYGVSKMSKEIFLEAALNVWKLRKTIRGNSPFIQFIKFGVTGGLGTITNLIIFFLLSDLAKIPALPVSIFCFLVAVTQNYFINQRWSFATIVNPQKASIRQYLMFIVSSLAGLIINLFVMELIINHYNLPYKVIAQALGILCGMVVNFIFSKLVVFRGPQS
jgi:dolichol-phosphate mannosyltransferase